MFQDGEQEYVTLSQAEYEAHIVGTSSNVNFEPEQIPSDNVEGLQPTIEIQSHQPTIDTTIGPMNFNFDQPCLESDQIPQSVRQSQMSEPDESQLPRPESQSQSRSKYSCPSCDKSYTQSHNLKKHRQTVHGLL